MALSTPWPQAVELLEAQRLAVTAAVADAQPAVAEELLRGLEAVRFLNVGHEEVRADAAHAGHGVPAGNLRKLLAQLAHQAAAFALDFQSRVQRVVEQLELGAHAGLFDLRQV